MFDEGKFLEVKKPNAEKDSALLENEEGMSLEKAAEKEILEKIKVEQQEARENFQDLIEMVSQRYEKMPEKMREDFLAHNAEILNNVVELGVRKGFSPEELKATEMAAILHDMTKADDAPEKFKNIKNYVLVMHGEKAAEEAKQILTDEYLAKQGFDGDSENIRQDISSAIREHMGPHPGFMSGMLEGVNAELEKIGEKEIVHPEAKGKISETLLAADMASLAGEKGRKKVLSIREQYYKTDDLKTVAEYAKYGIKLKQGEAALLSGFESAFQASRMINDETDKKWIDEAIKQSIMGDYSFTGEKITTAEAFQKMRAYNEARNNANRLNSVREQLAA